MKKNLTLPGIQLKKKQKTIVVIADHDGFGTYCKVMKKPCEIYRRSDGLHISASTVKTLTPVRPLCELNH